MGLWVGVAPSRRPRVLPALLSSSHVGPWQRQDSQCLGSSPSTVHTEGTWPRRLTQPVCRPRCVLAGLRQEAEPSPSSVGQRGHISPHQEHPFLISVPFCNWLICKCGSCLLPAPQFTSTHTHLLLILGPGSQDSQSEAPEVVAQPPLPKLPLGRMGDRLPPPGLSRACAFPHPLSVPPRSVPDRGPLSSIAPSRSALPASRPKGIETKEGR